MPIHTSLWTWESHAVRRFRFRRAVVVAIKQVGMFSLCYVFICFRNHSSRSRTERDKFVFGRFYRSTAWELRSLSAWEFYHNLTHGFEALGAAGAVDFAVKQVGKYFLMFLFARCLHLLVKIFIKVKNGLMMNPGVEKRSICVYLLYC